MWKNKKGQIKGVNGAVAAITCLSLWHRAGIRTTLVSHMGHLVWLLCDQQDYQKIYEQEKHGINYYESYF